MLTTSALLKGLIFVPAISAYLTVDRGARDRMDGDLFDKIQAAAWNGCQLYNGENQFEMASRTNQDLIESFASERYIWNVIVRHGPLNGVAGSGLQSLQEPREVLTYEAMCEGASVTVTLERPKVVTTPVPDITADPSMYIIFKK